MRLSPTPELLIALASAVLIVCAAAWWLFADTTAVNLGPPTIKGDQVVALRATVPVIGEFTRDYYTNDDDPFVPEGQRVSTLNRIQKNRVRPPGSHPNHHQPTPAPTPPVAPIQWPSATGIPPPYPICVGWVATAGASCLLARMSNGPTAALQLHVGESIGVDHEHQWTLLGISDDGLATFRDPSGKDEVFPIGGPQGDPPPGADTEPTNNGPIPGKKPPGNGPWQPKPPVGNPQPKRPRQPRQPPATFAPPGQGGGNQNGQQRAPFFPVVPPQQGALEK